MSWASAYATVADVVEFGNLPEETKELVTRLARYGAIPGVTRRSQAGYQEGYDEGREAGYSIGYADGIKHAQRTR